MVIAKEKAGDIPKVNRMQKIRLNTTNPVTNQVTKFVYSGDPVTGSGWVQSSATDMRFYQGFGPLNMNPGDTQVIVIAQVIARGSSNLNSITKLREASQIAKEYYDNFFEGIVIGINNRIIIESFWTESCIFWYLSQFLT